MTPTQPAIARPWFRRSAVVSALLAAGCATLQLPITTTIGGSPAPSGGFTPVPSPGPTGSGAPAGTPSSGATASATPLATDSALPGAAGPSPSPTAAATAQPTASPTPVPTPTPAPGIPTVTTLAGAGVGGFFDGNGTGAYFNKPQGLAIGADGALYVADASNMAIRRISPSGDVTVYANSSAHGGYKDSNLGDSWFSSPSDLVASGSGFVVCDTSNHLIRELRDGNVFTLAGSASANGIGLEGELNGPLRIASFAYPSSIAMNVRGQIAVKIPGVPNRYAASIRMIENGAVTLLIKPTWQPAGLAIDANGLVYVGETTSSAIRTVNQEHQEALLAGGTPGYADGKGSAAMFKDPLDVAFGPNGDLFVCDSSNSRIRRVTPQGVVTTVAGDGIDGYRDGPGLSARFSVPSDIAVDSAGDLYITESSNHRIRKITFSK